jgi:hypothetical protein
MLSIAIPLVFLSVTTFAPLSLAGSGTVIVSAFTILIFHHWKVTIRFLSHPAFLLVVMICGYAASAIVNEQSVHDLFLGKSGRNQGLLFWIAILILFMYVSNTDLSVKKFNKYGLLPLAVMILTIGLYQSVLNLLSENSNEGIELTLGNTNFAGSLIALGASLTLKEIAFEKSGRMSKYYSIAIFLVFIFLGYQTQTLQFFVLTIVGSLILFAIFSQKKKVYLKRNNLIFIIVMLTSLLFLVSFSIRKVMQQASSIDRLDFMQAALEIWKQNLAFGIGIENFSKFSPEFKTVRQVQLFGPNVGADKVHNAVLDHFVSGGLLVGIGYSMFTVVISFFALRLFINNSSRIEKSDLSLFAIIWTIWLIQSLFSPDFNLMTLLAVIAAGWISKTYFDVFKLQLAVKIYARHKYSNFSTLFTTLVLCSIIYVYTNTLINYYHLQEIYSRQSANVTEIKSLLTALSDSSASEDVVSRLLQDVRSCDAVEEILPIILQQNSRSHKYYYWKALCLSQENQNIESLDYVLVALKLFPNNLEYLETAFKLSFDLQIGVDPKPFLRQIKEISPANSLVVKYADLLN